MDISLAEASLLALFLETLLYGVFLTLYLLTLFILLRKTVITKRRFLIPVATLLLCIATAHLVIGFVRALQAFVFDTYTNADTYYADRASLLDLVKTALYITQTTLADCVIVWRCYVLNHRSLFIAIPGCIALLVNGVMGCYLISSLSKVVAGLTIPAPAGACITTFYALTMTISVTCTGLMAWRISRAPSLTPDGARPLLPVFIVIIETGALYATNVLALLIAFLVGSNGSYTALDVTTPIVGIAFCLVILQVHFQVGCNYPTEWPTQPRGMNGCLLRSGGARDADSIDRTAVLVTVHITKEAETTTEMV